MTHDQAVALMRKGIIDITGVWADFGCGHGTFSRALSELLGPLGTVIAIDHDDAKLQHVGPPSDPGAPIYLLDADFCYPLTLPPLDGFLLANSLHFVARQQKVLGQLATLLKPGGTALFSSTTPTSDRRGIHIRYPRRNSNVYAARQVLVRLLRSRASPQFSVLGNYTWHWQEVSLGNSPVGIRQKLLCSSPRAPDCTSVNLSVHTNRFGSSPLPRSARHGSPAGCL